uniref:Asparagine synthetase [glutamine-hydrolyzing] n=1 Tax=Setaria italica TaxID=4555 RepID=K3Y2J1_SETIT
LRHRGPDWSGLHCHQDCYLAHQRLAIVDPTSGDQLLYNEDKSVVVTVNGEIYNHEELKAKLTTHKFQTVSDCEVIAHLYEEYGEEFVDMLDGMFAFVLLDTRDKSFIAARDAIGICPLYMGWGLDGSVWFSSEMKALSDDCERFITFPPGHLRWYLHIKKGSGLRRWFNLPWFLESIPSTPYNPLLLQGMFEKAFPFLFDLTFMLICCINASGWAMLNCLSVYQLILYSVTKRLMTDVPFGVLLSGGLDSSLVASVASWHLEETKFARQWGNKLHTFCIGAEHHFLPSSQFYFVFLLLTILTRGSPDLKAAREVADYLGIVHHEFHFTVQEGIDALEEVIYHIETYDVTTIRASTPMFLMSRKIKSLGVKMVLSGEGSDEIFGGYLYFHKAPNKKEFHEETCRKIKALHLYDCLRANKATSAWGVEARVPFLHKSFINVAMDIDPVWKMESNFAVINFFVGYPNAFDDEKRPYLPKHILYRQKEQFSDGVGYSWIDGLKDHASEHVSDSMMMNASFVYPENTPTTKEGYYYRMIFKKYFPKPAARSTVPGGPSVACSTAKASGRAALGVHDAAYEDTPGAAPAAVTDNGLRPAIGESLVKPVAPASAV